MHRAEHTETGQQVALKMLVHVRPASLSRFKQEFRALSELRHPNLVRMLELFEHEGQWLIAMELVEGTDFLDWVTASRALTASNDNSAPFDEVRLRKSLKGVTEGLKALHGAGLIHRDLKPTNMRVTPEGRAVVLDFGLITALDSEAQSTHAGGIGTPAYMAPEQAAGTKVTAAADWYALGVCLYETLSGRLPFTGDTAMAVMFAKQGRLPPPPSARLEHSGTVPRDLEELCMRLLDPDPDSRAGAAEVLAVLTPESTSDSASGTWSDASGELASTGQSTVMPTLGVELAGRDNELQFLWEVFDDTQQGKLRLALVEGESGIGKSALVQEFTRQLKAKHEDALVLKGRCYENERVPYKAFDGCMDALTRALKRIPERDARMLMPPKASVLAQLFPVLGDVPAIVKAPAAGISADPTARRLEAFRALTLLLHKLALERPVVLTIDDLQWADAESFRLLRAIVESSDLPPLLVVFTTRGREELHDDMAGRVHEVRGYSCADVLSLKGLAPSGARQLAAQLLGPGVPTEWLRTIAEEGQGHPLFIDALVQYTTSRELGASGTVTLEKALSVRIEGLDPEPRRLLELLAVAARPHDRGVFARAIGGSLGAALEPLLDHKLARTRGARQLVCFHDRLRTQTERMIGAGSLKGLHRALAESLEQEPGSDPADRAFHWEYAGVPHLAVLAYEQAADAALQALAFGRAEQLYASGLTLVESTDATQSRRLTVQRAHALARGGRSRDAVLLYQQAAQAAHGEERVRLRIWASQHLLQSAQVKEGLAATHELLDELGMGLPRSTGAALRRIAWDRTRLGFRGLSLRTAPEGGVDPHTRLQLEAAWQLSAPVASVEVLPSANLSAAHLRRALDAGDPAHAARALAQEATMRSVQKPMALQAYAPLLETSRHLAEQVGDPALDAFVSWVEGMALGFRGELLEARPLFGRAEKRLRQDCPDEPWLLTNVRMSLGQVISALGEHRALSRQSRAWIAEAVERDDHFAYTALVGNGAGHFRHLMADAPEEALAELQESMAAWPREPFSSSRMGELAAMAAIHSYRGGPGMRQWLTQEIEQLQRAWLMKVPMMRSHLNGITTSASLAAWVAAVPDTRAALLADASKGLKALRRSEFRVFREQAALQRAQLLALEGRTDLALAEARRAREAMTDLGLYYQHGAGYLEGLLEGGEAGRARRAAAFTFFSEQGWKRPDRALAMVVPVLPALEYTRPRKTSNSAELFGGRFEVMSDLGRGAYGSVTEARDHKTGRTVALKELTQRGPRALFRFKQEFRALQGLHHPRLARLDALFEDRGHWFIAMQYVPGTDIRSWVRPQGHFDADRARDAFTGLAEGLSALHEAGFCHRDVKPHNVRVTPEGRVVLVDFGFVVELDSEAAEDDDAAVGTAAYMAPEQEPSADIAPAADLYAMGVCLYEALCGQVPFGGQVPIHIMQHKRRGPAPAPSQRAPDAEIPADLEKLALELLDLHPAKRPSAKRVASRLSGVLRSSHSLPVHSFRPDTKTFTGRDAELEQLAEAFARTGHGEPAVVLVEGASGIGKSALVEQWLTRLPQQQPPVQVLRGRCFENEQLPYNALDGVVDHLARVLRLRAPEVVAALLPPRAAVLAELFRVLGSVKAIGSAPKKGVLAEPNARRLQGFAALRTLLSNLCAEAPLVLAVDDLQWADLESFRLLRALLAEGEAPPPLMLVATIRPGTELEPALAEAVATLSEWPSCTRLALGPLPADDARTLATRLLGKSELGTLLDTVVTQAQGHPLFLSEMAAHLGTTSAELQTGELTLDAAVRTRVQALAPGPRTLLQMVALAGRPYGLHVYARALEGDERWTPQALDEALSALCGAQLLRLRKDQQLLCFHDRIRAVAAASVRGDKRVDQCLRLAKAVEAEPGADPAEVARLWERGGEPARAAVAYEQAAEAALEALAFGRAEQLYARSLGLTSEGDTEARRRLTVQRAHASARGGRSAEAVVLYQEAAEHAEGEERVRLRISAAQHLLQSAQVEEGMAATHALLDELGMGLPRGTGAALRRIAWDRTRLGFRGLDLKPAPQGGVVPHTRLQLEAAWQLSAPVAWVEVLPSANLSAAHLRRALDAGDPAHAARALAQEATMRAVQKPMVVKGYEPLLETSRQLADQVGDPALDAFVTWVEGMTWWLRGDFRTARPLFGQAEERLREDCPDEPWLLTNVRLNLGGAMGALGELRTLVEKSHAWVAEAAERDDRFAHTALIVGPGCLRHLVVDHPAEALAELQERMAAWPREPYSSLSFAEMGAMFMIESYRGGPGLLNWFTNEKERQDRAWLLRVPLMQAELLSFRAAAALAAWVVAPPDAQTELLARVRKALRALLRSDLPSVREPAGLLYAQLLAVEGRPDQALTEARRARQALTETGMFSQHSAGYLEGLLEGGEAGRERRDAAIAFHREQGWSRPDRALAMSVPVLPALE